MQQVSDRSQTVLITPPQPHAHFICMCSALEIAGLLVTAGILAGPVFNPQHSLASFEVLAHKPKQLRCELIFLLIRVTKSNEMWLVAIPKRRWV
jgi:hypothetical protein